MDRRTFLRVGAGIAGTTAVAGCLSDVFGSGPNEPPIVEDRPDAVYYPSHVEGMEMAGMQAAGDYSVALSYSFPHRFWLVSGQDRNRVEIREEDSVHLMGSIWDPETDIVPPTSNLRMRVTRDGEPVADKRMWEMLSQNMGFHFGDNVALDGDGTYDVEVSIDPIGARLTGDLRGRFDEPATAQFTVEYSQVERDAITFRTLDDRRGERGAVEPMEMEMDVGTMPLAQLPPADALPGDVVGEGESGDGTFVVAALDEPPAGVDGSGAYLAVSARTPYNRYPLPFMSLSATVARDGETVFDDALVATLDPDLDYHYGAVVDDLQPGDALTLSVGAPPQVARHEGYETAFLEMDDVELTVP